MLLRTASIAVILSVLFSGCAVTKVPQPTGGSKADGTVHLSYEYGSFEQPTVDEEAALRKAQQRCQAWGYDDADAFGGAVEQCQQSNQYGCTRYFVTMTYQCMD